MAERVGVVTEIRPPAEGKKMYGVKINGRTGRFYGTQFESDEPNEILLKLRDAENRGLSVRATGDEITSQGMKYPMFKITDVEILSSEAAQNGSSSAQVQTFQDNNRDRSIIAQVAYKVAGGLAASGAIPAEALSAHAGYIFYGIQELAEGKATGNDQEAAQ